MLLIQYSISIQYQHSDLGADVTSQNTNSAVQHGFKSSNLLFPYIYVLPMAATVMVIQPALANHPDTTP